jgi:prealbumin domain-containing protein
MRTTMKRNLTLPILLAAGFSIWQVTIGAECIGLGPPGPPPPPKPPRIIRVSGAFCGTAFDASGRFGNAELRLKDQSGSVDVAKAATDSQGNFRFVNLPIGTYRVYEPGFTPSEELLEITGADQHDCQHPLFVKMTVDGECAPSSHIGTVPPSAK